MKEKRECKIVRDLLPNYIEKLTDEETNQYIEEHLNECDECKEILDNMQKEFEIETNKRDNREVKYIKKYRRELKVFQYIVLIFLIIFVVIISRRIIILANLTNKALHTIETDNYYKKTTAYGNESILVSEEYYKDGKGIKYSNIYNYKVGTNKLIQYMDLEQKESFEISRDDSEIKGSKIVSIGLPIEGIYKTFSYGYAGNWATILLESFTLSIQKVEYYGQECYLMKYSDKDIIVNADNGLVVKAIWNTKCEDMEKLQNRASVIDFVYSFNTVVDEDIVRPDLSEYVILDNREKISD